MTSYLTPQQVSFGTKPCSSSIERTEFRVPAGRRCFRHRAPSGARCKERYREHYLFHPVSNNHHQVGVVVSAPFLEFSNETISIVECGCVIRQQRTVRIVICMVGPPDAKKIPLDL